MRTNILRTIGLTLFAIAALALPASTALAGETYEVRYDGLFMVGNEVYQGGDMHLTQISGSQYYALSVNGQRIATLYRQGSGANSRNAMPALIFRSTQNGAPRLVGFGESVNKQSVMLAELKVANQSPGVCGQVADNKTTWACEGNGYSSH